METLSPIARNKRGKVIHSAKRLCIVNNFKHLSTENPTIKKDKAMEKVAEMTGVSKRSVYSVINVYLKNKTLGLSSPKNKKSRVAAVDKLDEFTKCAIRRKVHEFFFKNEQPTINKILSAVNNDKDLPDFKRSTLYKLLKSLNFKFHERRRNMFICDRDDIVVWRRNYLRKIKQFREEGRKIYYQDETWVNAGHVKNKVWQDKTIKSPKDAFLKGLSTGLRSPKGKGSRLIVVHMGCEEGFLKDGLMVFQSKSTADYHEEMTGNVFEDYFRELLPSLEDNSVVVLDNAPYHSVKCEKIPNMSWKKNEIANWLKQKGFNADSSYLKKELLYIVEQEKGNYDKYVIDEMAKKENKTVLRLPPYHCELNPIELIWAQVKNHVAANNTTFKLADVKRLLEEGVEKVTEEDWKKCIEHVKKEEAKLWELDNLIEEMEESGPLIINVGNDDTSSDPDLAMELE